ncbi:trypsin-like peptidase domain-containing protein [Corynebacterium sp. A21]|uniref:trypsin-like peptidase domain-containing protein n=1 Tax=Corynebacterium sp. A21 TaxID=3457318 RepID=UPI003FD1BA8C
MNEKRPEDPRQDNQGWSGGQSSSPDGFESVNSPYQGWNSPTSNPGSTAHSGQNPVPGSPPQGFQQQSYPPQFSSFENSASSDDPASPSPVKKKRSIGLLPATALIVAAAVAAGAITGVLVGNSNSSGGNGFSALDAPSAERVEEAPVGSVEQVADATLPSVVSLKVTSRTAVGEGSGSIISADGLVLTNHHVVAEAEAANADIQVTLNDERTLPADFVASDPSTDIAVVKIRNVQDLPVIQFGDSDQLQVGQQVVAIGSPLGLSSTVTTGIVSAMNRPVRASGGDGGESSLIDAVQTDAAINPGNSGGPLVDMEGNLIGMNSVIASMSSGADSAGSIGLGFAIPSNFAKRVADQLVNTGSAAHPMIGVQVAANANVSGALVASVQEDGPAAAAGLEEGDVITHLGDRAIDNSDELIAAVRSEGFGTTVTLTVTREGSNETREVDVTLTTE